MARSCLLCGKELPSGRLTSGRDARARFCPDCRQLPRAVRQKTLLLDEMATLWKQTDLSPEHVRRLEELAVFPDQEVQRRATLLLRVAQTAPRNNRRASTIRGADPELYRALTEEGLISDREKKESR